jgi:hypothetical protein
MQHSGEGCTGAYRGLPSDIGGGSSFVQNCFRKALRCWAYLGVPVEYFYEGGPEIEGTQTGYAEGATDSVPDFLKTNEGIQIMKAFMRIKDPAVRRRVIGLIDALGEKPGS